MKNSTDQQTKEYCHKTAQLPQSFLHSLRCYAPLIIILIYCILLSSVHMHAPLSQQFMYNFMGYFFVFLSLFKFFDLKGFVDGFSTYDLIANHIRGYGYMYPGIELILGISYLMQWTLLAINSITLIFMLISGLGVMRSIVSGKKVQCACLGTTLKVPLSTVSVLENFGMGAMAAYHLFTNELLLKLALVGKIDDF